MGRYDPSESEAALVRARRSMPWGLLRSPLVLRSGLALIDQSLLSALSFVVSIFLIRVVSKVEYGYYAVAVPASLFLVSLQNALVNTPLTVLLAGKHGSDRQRYLGGLLYGQLVAILPVASLGLGAAALLRWWGIDPGQSAVAAAVCAAIAGLLLREFTLSYLFAVERPGRVLQMDVLYALLFLGSVAITHWLVGITVPTMILLTGASGLGAAAAFLRGLDWRWEAPTARASFLENWQLGRWALVGVVVTHLQSYSYMYLLAALVGSTAVADVSAARLLLMPLMLVQTGWAKIAVPHGSRLREGGEARRFFSQVDAASAALAAGGLLYVGALLHLSGFLLHALLSDKYASAFEYLPLWGAVLILTVLELNASAGLLVAKRFLSSVRPFLQA
jgi:O-antigen/teichoic acid export membrane protein